MPVLYLTPRHRPGRWYTRAGLIVPCCLFIAGTAWLSAQTARREPSASEADALYAAREDLAKARRAAAIWAEQLAHEPRDFEAGWRLARAQYWIGGHLPERDQRRQLERGIEAAQAAAAAQPNRPEGHFWLAANMGALAESQGLRAGLKYRGKIREELELVLKIDPAFQQGSADRALGRWFHKVPRLFGGNKSRAEQHLRRSLSYNPVSTASLYFLADLLLETDRDQEARAVLGKVLDAPLDREWAPEDREFKAKAQKLLARPARQPQPLTSSLSICKTLPRSSVPACRRAPSV